MSEQVQRIRTSPGGWDDNGDPVDSTETTTPLTARAVAPGASITVQSLGRNGENIDYSVFFTTQVDLTDDDELIVRGNRCKIRVLEWHSAFSTGRRGMQVLASIGRG